MPYLNNYCHLLKVFYNLNKLKINNDKTNLTLINNPRHHNEVKNTIITTNTDTIKPKEKFTILGWVINRRLDYSDHLNNVSSRIHHRMHRAKEVLKFMSTKTKTTFANSYLFSILNYGAPLMYYSNANIQQRMHALHMK